MPLPRTRLISDTDRGGSLQRLGNSGPDRSMLQHISVAVGHELDDRQTGFADRSAQLSPEADRVPRSSVRCTEEPGRRGNIKRSGRAEERVECCRVKLLGLGKKREDAATVVVEHDNSGIQPELRGSKHAIQIMEER